MTFYMRLYFAITLFLGLSSAQGPASPATHCHSDWIENDDLRPTCTCELGDATKCSPRDLGTCSGKALISASELMDGHGNEGCTEANAGCNSCFLWFDKVCTCLKNGKCDESPSGLWIQLNDGKITTKQRMPGILELASEEPWEWGQSLATSSQALVINSVKTRHQEQIHMHVCEAKPGKPGIREILGDLKRPDYGTLQQVKNREWMCRVQSTKNTPITGVTRDIRAKTLKDPGCSNLVGAAVVTDTYGYTWMCLTTGLGSTQGEFCA